MQKMSDADLMRLVMQKHRPALEELYDRYIKLVYSFALKSTIDEQQARELSRRYLSACGPQKKGYDESKGQFVNWLLTITRNITVDHLRWKSEIRLSCPSNRSVGSTSPIIRPATRLTSCRASCSEKRWKRLTAISPLVRSS